jgi:hypothetical protein
MRRALGRNVGNRDHLTPRGVLLPGAGMHVAHPARTNDAYLQRIHERSIL